jgi:hypothetical protein
MPLDSLNVCTRRSSAATRPKSSSAFGRRFARIGLESAQSEQDRRQRLASLVVELAREPAAFDLLPGDDPTQRVAGDALREVDGNRRAHCELLGES